VNYAELMEQLEREATDREVTPPQPPTPSYTFCCESDDSPSETLSKSPLAAASTSPLPSTPDLAASKQFFTAVAAYECGHI
jgi:hypothetical protein